MPRKEGIACTFCGDVMLGKTVAEAIADAIAIGWDKRPSGWVCPDCILEEESL